MKFLAINEVWEWCNENGIDLSEKGDSLSATPPELANRARKVYAPKRRSGLETAAAVEALRALGSWHECLLWVTGWGVWPSSEDWPSYYAKRGAAEERRSLNDAPGHLFDKGEHDLLLKYLVAVMENGWDGYLLCNGSVPQCSARVQISHDGWFEVASEKPVDLGELSP